MENRIKLNLNPFLVLVFIFCFSLSSSAQVMNTDNKDNQKAKQVVKKQDNSQQSPKPIRKSITPLVKPKTDLEKALKELEDKKNKGLIDHKEYLKQKRALKDQNQSPRRE